MNLKWIFSRRNVETKEPKMADETARGVRIVKEYLAMIADEEYRSQAAQMTKSLFLFLKDGGKVLLENPRFKDVAIQKAEELLRQNSDISDLAVVLKDFLATQGVDVPME